MQGLWRALVFPLRRWPRLSRAALVSLVLIVGLVGLANAYVLLRVEGSSTGNVADVPHKQTAIVPGALVNPDGTMSTMLADRVSRAAELWQAGKVDRILVSGDHHTWAYDEPDTMRKALVRDGVPGRAIFEDHAGFDTWATMVRARSIFGVRSAVIVTQGFHMSRALYLAEAAGIDASGLTSDLHPYGIQGVKSDLREALKGQGGRRRGLGHPCDWRSTPPDLRRRPFELGSDPAPGNSTCGLPVVRRRPLAPKSTKRSRRSI